MNFYFTEVAQQKLQILQKNDQTRIFQKITWFCQQDNPLVFARLLQNLEIGQYRWRVGRFRVIFDVVGNGIYILNIDRRDKIYK